MKILGPLVLVWGLVLAGCGTTPAALPGPAVASPSRLVDPVAFAVAVAEPDRTTVNVHVPFEGDLPGTDTAIAYDRVAAGAGRLPADRAAPLTVYCRTGPMSAEATRTLASLGYTDIVELDGGMVASADAGRPPSATPLVPR